MTSAKHQRGSRALQVLGAILIVLGLVAVGYAVMVAEEISSLGVFGGGLGSMTGTMFIWPVFFLVLGFAFVVMGRRR